MAHSSSSSSPNSNTSPVAQTSPMTAFGQPYVPNQQDNPFAGCYVPQPANADYQFQPCRPQQFQQYPQYQMPRQQFQMSQPFQQFQQYPQYQMSPQQMSPPFFSQPPPFYSTQPSQEAQPAASVNTQAEPSRKQKNSRKGKKPSTSSSPKKRNRNVWSDRESLSLAQAWIAVSEDPSISTNQTRDSFWYRVLMIHNINWAQENRTKDSLSGKWTELNKKVKAFNGIHTQLSQTGHRSGTNDADILTAALGEYRMTQGHDFPLLTAWEFLRDKEKFLNPDPVVIGRRNRKRTSDTGTSETDPVNLDADEYSGGEDPFHADGGRNPRPPGRPSKSARTSSGSGRSSGASVNRIEQRLDEISIQKSHDQARVTENIQRIQKLQEKKLAYEFLSMSSENMHPVAAAALEADKEAILEKIRSGYYDM